MAVGAGGLRIVSVSVGMGGKGGLRASTDLYVGRGEGKKTNVLTGVQVAVIVKVAVGVYVGV